MENKKLDGYIIPSCDAHNSEYTPEWDRRIEYISQFSGSAGMILVTLNNAFLWTDGRYFLQAERELDLNEWTIVYVGRPDAKSIYEIICELKLNNIGYDPYLHTMQFIEKIQCHLTEANRLQPIAEKISLNGLEKQENLIDLIWTEKQISLLNDIKIVSIEQCGKTSTSKLDDLRKKLNVDDKTMVIVSSLDQIAWLMNLRGSDIPYSRLFVAYLIILRENAHIFLMNSISRKKTTNLITYLNSIKIVLHDYNDITQFISGNFDAETKIIVENSCNLGIINNLQKIFSSVTIKPLEIDIHKAIKTPEEINGMIRAHVYDGVALAAFFCYLDTISLQQCSELDEVKIDEILTAFRMVMKEFICLSFATIVGIRENSAVIHYKAKEENAKKINDGGILLIDSGAHYVGGTTDVTRTVYIGKPDKKCIEFYTRVLIGHLDLGSIIFPDNQVKGSDLDILARKKLWETGMDYLHGTGHGVGHSLVVHEAPPSISLHGSYEALKFKFVPNLVVSNEPGVYFDNEFGIRLENLQYTKPKKTLYNFNNINQLEFKQLTLHPYSKKLIDINLLDNNHILTLNNYHKTVFQILKPEIKNADSEIIKISSRFGCEINARQVLDWLEKECQEI